MEEAKKIDDANEVLELTISYEERGKEIGKKEGKEIGKEEARKQIALRMVQKNLDVDLIMEVTMLSLDEIERLRKEYE